MKIEGEEIDIKRDYLSPVTYVPRREHSLSPQHSNQAHCEQGVIIACTPTRIGWLNCKTRTVQAVDPNDLVWG